MTDLEKEYKILLAWKVRAIKRMIKIDKMIKNIFIYSSDDFNHLQFLETILSLKIKLIKPKMKILELYVLQEEFKKFIKYVVQLNNTINCKRYD